jgi:hypothetical protein
MIDVGQRVGNYNITAKLGEGGMGTVFLAEHPVIGSKVALKAIHPEFARSADVVSRFINEAKAVNQIGHDHIVDITDFGTAPSGDFYFMMEYLEGQGLAQAIRAHGALAPTRALNIAVQIADALGASHARGIIHRDLKPENIILIVHGGIEDFVKVLDFGLAKLMNSTELPSHHSRTGSVMGTPFYMSPEQCEGRLEIDHRADIYALGVILFEMLTGKIPFGGEGYGEIIVKHVTVPAPAARSIIPDLSPALDMILFRALSKAPDRRFQSMTEFREALLDPEGYSSALPIPGALADMTERVRAAVPMARAEMKGPAVVSSQPQYIDGLGHAPSTFRDSAGEVWVREGNVAPKHRRGRVALLVGVALAALTIAGIKFRNQARSFMAAATAPSKPSTVRVNLNSEPDGATVVRADGTVLGVTPLSTDAAYGDKPIEYVFRLRGYESRTTSIVPNLPSPVFAVLQKIQPSSVVQAAPIPEPAIAGAPVVTGPTAITERAVARSARTAERGRVAKNKHAVEADSDGTMQPSAP